VRPRRLALLPVIALAVIAGSFGASAARASAHSAPATICVALVVDGRALGSDVSTTCAKVPKGSTGTDVLEAAGHPIGYRNDGLICTIDGLPKAGCSGIDDGHYWAYFHRAPGATKWIYSSEGAGTYEPANASTEGWVYDNGTTNTPENVPYDQICKPTASPSSSPTPPTPAPTKKAAPTPRTTDHRSTATQPTAASATPTPSAATKKATHHEQSAPPTSSEAPSRPPKQTISATAAALAGAVPPASSGHSATGLVIGVVVVAGLGILAVVRFRRSPR
jgi:hypothetical protein